MSRHANAIDVEDFGSILTVTYRRGRKTYKHDFKRGAKASVTKGPKKFLIIPVRLNRDRFIL